MYFSTSCRNTDGSRKSSKRTVGNPYWTLIGPCQHPPFGAVGKLDEGWSGNKQSGGCGSDLIKPMYYPFERNPPEQFRASRKTCHKPTPQGQLQACCSASRSPNALGIKRDQKVEKNLSGSQLS